MKYMLFLLLMVGGQPVGPPQTIPVPSLEACLNGIKAFAEGQADQLSKPGVVAQIGCLVGTPQEKPDAPR